MIYKIPSPKYQIWGYNDMIIMVLWRFDELVTILAESDEIGIHRTDGVSLDAIV